MLGVRRGGLRSRLSVESKKAFIKPGTYAMKVIAITANTKSVRAARSRSQLIDRHTLNAVHLPSHDCRMQRPPPKRGSKSSGFRCGSALVSRARFLWLTTVQESSSRGLVFAPLRLNCVLDLPWVYWFSAPSQRTVAVECLVQGAHSCELLADPGNCAECLCRTSRPEDDFHHVGINTS
jgi:hypothetical protein